MTSCFRHSPGQNNNDSAEIWLSWTSPTITSVSVTDHKYIVTSPPITTDGMRHKVNCLKQKTPGLDL